MANKKVNVSALIVVALLGLVYAARIGPPATYPAFGFDNSVYLVSAKALAEGHGYRLINHPDSPVAPYYPIGYPALLSVALRFVSLDAAGITLLRSISALACLIFSFLSYQLLRQYVTPLKAAAIVLLIGLQPMVVLWAGETWSECPFAMWSVAAVLLATLSLKNRTEVRRNLWLYTASAGLCAGMAMLTRTIGVTLIAGVALAFVSHRKWHKLIVFTIASGLIVVPWLLWSALYVGGGNGANNYMKWASARYHWWVPIENLWSLIADISPYIYFPPAGTTGGRLLLDRLYLSWIPPFVGLIISIVFLIGMIALLKRRDAIVYCVICYLTVVVIYPWEPSRFLMPIYPLLAVLLIEGGKILWQRRSSSGIRALVLYTCIAALLAVNIAGLLAVNFVRIRNVYVHNHFNGARGAEKWNEMSSAFDWIRRNTPKEAIIISLYSYGTYLFTDRLTVTQPTAPEELEEVIAKLSIDTPVYIFAVETYLDVDREASITPLREFMAKNSGRVTLVWATSDHTKLIYEISSRSANTVLRSN